MLLKILACALVLVLVSDLASAQWRGRQVQLQTVRQWNQEYDVCMASNSPFRFYNSPVAACGKVIAASLSNKEKRAIVDLHNELRKNVARGLESRGEPGPQPAATNMKLLKWDDKLARTAQNLVNACIPQRHDQCRHYPDLTVGQNLGWKWTTRKYKKGELPLDGKIEEIINDWYNEVRSFNSANVKSYQHVFAVGHYTQLVWAETNRIGCGAVKYFQGGKHNLLLACNYAPSGNVIGMPVYKTS
ncbi:hypothetical protein TKK_0007406 [Trichogramma kaykai]|uniref:SCP domain-containing protein n=1 Tax=Trichogramma kaykai TaxID=54128 RepID=A0ABD2WGC4_9HYME